MLSTRLSLDGLNSPACATNRFEVEDAIKTFSRFFDESEVRPGGGFVYGELSLSLWDTDDGVGRKESLRELKVLNNPALDSKLHLL